jgi:DNA gyrase subunit A
MGRATQGVTLINVDENSTLSGVRRVVESDADDVELDGDADESSDVGAIDSDDGPAAPGIDNGSAEDDS